MKFNETILVILLALSIVGLVSAETVVDLEASYDEGNISAETKVTEGYLPNFRESGDYRVEIFEGEKVVHSAEFEMEREVQIDGGEDILKNSTSKTVSLPYNESMDRIDLYYKGEKQESIELSEGSTNSSEKVRNERKEKQDLSILEKIKRFLTSLL